MTVTYFDTQTFDKFRFDIPTLWAENSVVLKWNESILIESLCKFLWDERNFVESSLISKWSEVHSFLPQRFDTQKFDSSVFDSATRYASNSVAIKWNESGLIEGSIIVKYDERIFVENLSKFLWDQRNFVENFSKFLWDQRNFIENLSKFLWDETGFAENSLLVKYNERNFAETYCKLLWNNRAFVENFNKFLWDERFFVSNSSKLLWDARAFATNSCKFLWIESGFAANNVILKWNEGPPLPWPLVDYILVVTPQGRYIYPEILGGTISFKSGSVGLASLQLSEFIPEDCRCTFYLNGGIRLFDGISRRCTKSKKQWTVTIQDYSEIIKPQDLQGGLVLAKQTWHDVTLANLVSSSKPADNNNIVGLLYMASSAIPYHWFEIHDTTHYVYKWIYTGTTYTIPEVYQDATLLTQRANAAALNSNPGWYHDTSANTLYVRCTDNVSPYFHAISVPYIGEQKSPVDCGALPVRIGDIQDQASTVIGYWETAHGDIPMDILNNLLDALKLEKEYVIRNGYCYIDIATKIGAGTSAVPANTYSEDENLISVDQLDFADARSMVNSVLFTGYGQGAGGVVAGKHINMGRGWRHILLDDATIHSTAMAKMFVQNYLDRSYLPARTIKATVPLKVGDTIDQRRIGDTVHFSIDSEHIEQDLRIQEISIKLKPLTMGLTAGDRLTTFEQQYQAMKKAAENWRKHTEDLTDTYSYNWSQNLNNGAAKSDKFNITADILKVQKLELTCTTGLYTDEISSSVPGGGGGDGGGDGGGGDTPGTEPVPGHTHPIGGSTGTPSATTSVAPSSHIHYITVTTGSPSATTSVAPSSHIHYITVTTGSPSATTSVASTGHTHTYSATTGAPSGTTNVCSSVSVSTGCCTAVNCGKQWVSGVSAVNGEPVASSSHTHYVSGTTSGASGSTDVASGSHTHSATNAPTGISSLTVDVASGTHTHATTNAPTGISSSTVDVGSSGHTHSLPDATGLDSGHYHEMPVVDNPWVGQWTNNVSGDIIPEQITQTLPSGSDPEMYLDIRIDNVSISGSPFVIYVNDDVGTVPVDTLVTTAGDHTVSLSLSNKTTPGAACRIKFSLSVQGRIFVDTIIKS